MQLSDGLWLVRPLISKVVLESDWASGFAAGDVNLQRYVGNSGTNTTDPASAGNGCG